VAKLRMGTSPHSGERSTRVDAVCQRVCAGPSRFPALAQVSTLDWAATRPLQGWPVDGSLVTRDADVLDLTRSGCHTSNLATVFNQPLWKS
jgi:hypothetical protein